MTTPAPVLLINPTMTSRSGARFPLSLLSVAAALGAHDCRIIDGNIERDFIAASLQSLQERPVSAVGITVMGGPQLKPAIQLSRAIRDRFASVPIIWGGYFPTLYPDAALNASYVDYAIRGQGEDSLPELLAALAAGSSADLSGIAGLSWKRLGERVHNPDRRLSRSGMSLCLPYEKLGDPRKYLARTFLGRRTAAHQAARGCRFRCTFCGVAAMFGGATALPAADKLKRDLLFLKEGLGADSIQFYDHNFFDREVDMVPLLQIMAKIQLPWWCYARSDALLNLSEESWSLVRRSRLRMAYIGAESPSDQLLHDIRKGTRSDQTLAVAELCRRHGVIPELSFMVAPPVDTEAETERTFEFIRALKKINPQCEIIVYVYTPLPPGGPFGSPRSKRPSAALLDLQGNPVVFPETPEEWTQQRWVDYACHADAPWLDERLRRRIQDFVTVLRCRFPTAQDMRSPPWAKRTLKAAAAWRYRYRWYDRPWELNVANRIIRLRDPRASSL